MFEIATTDLAGNRRTFTMPLLFIGEVPNDIKMHPPDDPIKDAYNADSTRRSADLGGATICYAPFDPNAKGDTRLPTGSITFRAGNLTKKVTRAPNFYPEIDTARIGIVSIQKMLGKSFDVDVTYPDAYKNDGFAADNSGMLFLKLTQPRKLEFGEGSSDVKSDSLGALASPQMAIQGLSQKMGPVSAKPDEADPSNTEKALGKIIANKFAPSDFFQGATILGGISLAEIIKDVGHLLDNDAVPKLLSRETPGQVEATFDWMTTDFNQIPLFLPSTDPVNPTKLTIHSVITTPLNDPQNANYSATAKLEKFKINLFGFVIISFKDLAFTSIKGQKPDVTLNLEPDGIQFGGPLEFINTLQEYIPENGFSDPPNIIVTPSGISAGYSLNLPSISLGVFTLSGVSVGAGFNLPFDSKPASVKFNFSERQHPFSLTVSMLGGGGFCAIGVSSRGVDEIEAALEFGAAVAIDLGVASGGVEIKAGVYFHWLETDPNKPSVELAGYVRLHGELSVLGLISASLTFNLQLTYELNSNVVWGEATLVVEVEVLFFSADVSVQCRREFAGSESDPKFKNLIPDQSVWDDYCSAFAPEAIT
jgi:hypothetical protein